jgi:hypothetical protein
MNKTTMRLMAGLATTTAAHILVQLLNRDTFNEDDLDFVLQVLAGDPSLDAIAQAKADVLHTQIADIRRHQPDGDAIQNRPDRQISFHLLSPPSNCTTTESRAFMACRRWMTAMCGRRLVKRPDTSLNLTTTLGAA